MIPEVHLASGRSLFQRRTREGSEIENTANRRLDVGVITSWIAYKRHCKLPMFYIARRNEMWNKRLSYDSSLSAEDLTLTFSLLYSKFLYILSRSTVGNSVCWRTSQARIRIELSLLQHNSKFDSDERKNCTKTFKRRAMVYDEYWTKHFECSWIGKQHNISTREATK